ncbi:hypothetical protein [Streptomyces sp. NPDC088400]|uniref:hypothetical protein n=1 Tax=Streptomyces sp. NPDC088400 TaxID=3365861 RepID=UPI0038301F0F
MTGVAVSEAIPPLPGGKREWVVGACWLYCRREGVTVSWVGPVWSSGAHAPLFACSDCITELDGLVRRHLAMQDGYKAPLLSE